MQCSVCKRFCNIDESEWKLIHKCYRLYCHKLRDYMGIKITKINTLTEDKNKDGMSYKKCIQELLMYFMTTEEICMALRLTKKEFEESKFKKCLIYGPPNKWKHYKQMDAIEDVYRTVHGVDFKKELTEY